MIRTVTFIHSEQPVIDRGWDPRDVQTGLQQLGIETIDVSVPSIADLQVAITKLSCDTVVWPVCYTVGSAIDGPLLTEVLERASIPFFGPRAATLALNSKIRLKEALRDTQLHTPEWMIADSDSVQEIPFAAPYILKTEYTCDSQGVRVVHEGSAYGSLWRELQSAVGQRIIAEKWARLREFTVSFVPLMPTPVVAALEMQLAAGRVIVDAAVKTDNRLLSFGRPESDLERRVCACAGELASSLGLDGHFRVDILLDADGVLQVIDLNFLPQMHFAQDCLSYFPAALRQTYGLDCQAVICLLLDMVQGRWNIRFQSAVQDEISRVRSELCQ